MAKALEVYKVTNNDTYPTALADGNIKMPDTGTYSYQGNGATYCLSGTNTGITYRVTSSVMNPTQGICPATLPDGSYCPTGYIVVPPDNTFSTAGFCAMKYEAKNASGIAVSTASGAPWTSITQTAAITTATAACAGCHLTTEAEWMTIAANVLSVPSNWSSGTVGTGYIYQGHVNDNPGSGLSASTDDTDGLNGITGGTGAVGSNSRRTLTLSNGEVIWDFSGNVWEWTNATIAGGSSQV